jgi:DNA-binding response OmpR family regulator
MGSEMAAAVRRSLTGHHRSERSEWVPMVTHRRTVGRTEPGYVASRNTKSGRRPSTVLCCMRNGNISVLVIEDEADIRQLLRTMLEREGFTVTEAMLGRDGVRLFHQKQPNLVILDVGMPDLDGWQVLERIRDMSDVPVLMLTALSTERDKVRGLNAGADDYLTKPFSRVELLARIQAISRRQVQRNEPIVSFEDGSIRVDFSESQVTVDGVPVVLTPTEYRLLATLVRHQGQVLSSDQLIELAWDDPSGLAPSRVKYAVLRLRRKLGWGDQDDGPIETVRGFGYRYRARAR